MTITYSGGMVDNGGVRFAGSRLAVDVVLFTRRDSVLSLLVVERAKEPFLAALALSGGFVERGERSPEAAVRELAEETGIQMQRDRLRRLGCYSAVGRDPRGRVVSVVYHGYVPGAPTAKGAGDARVARWIPVVDFLSPGTPVAFDHRDIVADAVVRRFGATPDLLSGEGIWHRQAQQVGRPSAIEGVRAAILAGGLPICRSEDL